MPRRGRLDKNHEKYSKQGHAIRRYYDLRQKRWASEQRDNEIPDYMPATKRKRSEKYGDYEVSENPRTDFGGSWGGRVPTDEEMLAFGADDTDDDDWGDTIEQPMQTAMLGAGPDGGSGGGGGGSGPAPERERPFGSKPHTVTRHYKKSFLVNVDNGTTKLKLQFAAPANNRPVVTWNEGWYCIPWGFFESFMTPTDWFELTTMARQFRVKSIKVELEGMIPFQVNLTGGTNSTTATFSNRPNLHIYVDDAAILPDLGTNDRDAMQHSNFWTRPWDVGQGCLLKSPDFTFLGNSTPQIRTITSYSNTAPQDYFSLYTTGKVKTMYPGQKFHHVWRNPKRSWQSIRVPADDIANGMATLIAGGSQPVEEDLAKKLGANYTGHVGWSGKNYNQLPITDGVDVSNNYYDTGFPVSKDGPPYIMCRMEVYPDLGTGGSAINIYSQMHVHYSAELEYLPMEKRYTYLPAQPNNLLLTTSADAFSTGNKIVGAQFSEGRVIHRTTGPSKNDAFYL